MGTAKMIEEMKPKMKFLEETKKYVYNNDGGKTEIMKMKLKSSQSHDQNPRVTRVYQHLQIPRGSV